MRVPFLDVLSSMVDPTLPLTVEVCRLPLCASVACVEWLLLALQEREEWGDPLSDTSALDAIKGFSPYEGLAAQRYPPMLLSAVENDTRVPFTQALRYLARLRHRSRSVDSHAQPPQVLQFLSTGGHHGEGGRFRRLEHAATELSFLLHAVK